jgi:CheY-like chemotaxis protein/anti-sigma regulatory factor (Ser/Thr protein kinase)
VVAVIADLHAFSRIESEHLRSVDVEAVVNEACKLVQKQASYRARLTRRLGVTGPVRGDHHRLVQVVAGLLVNAIHAVPEGAPEQNEIEVGTASSRGEVRVWVRDTGAGMTPEVRARVFEPFFTTKPTDSGTGLGLAIAAEIVRRYGGHIDVKSEPGEGSTFTVTLPAVDVALAPAPVPSATAVSRARVLIIDDEKALLKVFARLLGVRHEVVLATGGREALALIEGGLVPDVVLCDLMMPEIDGVAVHDELARSHPALHVRRDLHPSHPARPRPAPRPRAAEADQARGSGGGGRSVARRAFVDALRPSSAACRAPRAPDAPGRRPCRAWR